MKIRIDENYTTIAQLPMVKEAVKVFKEAFKNEDCLIELYQNSFGTDYFGLEVVSVDVDAFPLSSYELDCACSFNVRLVARSYFVYAEFDFFVHNNSVGGYEVAEEENLHSVVIFGRK